MDRGHWELRGYGIWALKRRVDGETIGGCGFSWSTGWPRSELTWWLLDLAQGVGFVTEASRVAITFGYNELGWELVETHMVDENQVARRLVLRLGGEFIARELFPDGCDHDVFRLHPI